MPYPVQNLIEGRGEPTCVRPADSVETALRLMIEHDFSQLPVVDEEKKPLGMITYGSILRALYNFGVKVENLCVSDAIVRTQKYRLEDDLFDLLDRLGDANAVLIVDGDEKLVGIVTSYDSTEYFRRRAEDMMLVEDIETMVKDLVLAPFTSDSGEVDQVKLAAAIEEITSSKQALLKRYRNALRHYLKLQGQERPQITSQDLEASFSHLDPRQEPRLFEDLTLYEYAELLLHKSRWDSYRPIFNLEPEPLRKLLGGIRETRNALAHFRGEIAPDQRDQLRFCVDWFAQHQIREPGLSVTRIPPRPDIEIVPTEEVLEPSDSRYAPLAIWLQSQPAQQDQVPLAFQQVEEIIGGELPTSARQHRSWWANDSVGHVQSQQWLDVGWRVSRINMTDEKVVFTRIKEREKAYIGFFSALQGELERAKGFSWKKHSPDGQCWLTVAALPESGPQCLFFNFSFGRRKRFRIDLYIDTGAQETNKRIFDRLGEDQTKIEAAVGEELSWERLDEKRASRIALYHPGAITESEKELALLRAWAVDAMVRFYKALAQPAGQALTSIEPVGS